MRDRLNERGFPDAGFAADEDVRFHVHSFLVGFEILFEKLHVESEAGQRSAFDAGDRVGFEVVAEIVSERPRERAVAVAVEFAVIVADRIEDFGVGEDVFDEPDRGFPDFPGAQPVEAAELREEFDQHDGKLRLHVVPLCRSVAGFLVGQLGVALDGLRFFDGFGDERDRAVLPVRDFRRLRLAVDALRRHERIAIGGRKHGVTELDQFLASDRAAFGIGNFDDMLFGDSGFHQLFADRLGLGGLRDVLLADDGDHVVERENVLHEAEITVRHTGAVSLNQIPHQVDVLVHVRIVLAARHELAHHLLELVFLFAELKPA